MKTISLKMLLVAALVAAPAVMAHEGCNATPAETPAVQAAPAAATTSYYEQAKNAFATAGTKIASVAGTVAAVPSEAYAWVTASKANAAAATVIAAFLAKEAYTYATAPAKANQ